MAAVSGAPETRVYVGTFAQTEGQAKDEGIYAFRVGPRLVEWSLFQRVPDLLHPSYLATHPSGRYLYAATRPEETEGQPGGAICAFAIEPATGTLTYLNRQPSHGFGPCYVSVERSGRYVLAANYRSGSVAMLPIRADGSLGPANDWIQHAGKGPHPNQDGPHAHCIVPDPSNRYALVCDLGLDRVFIYRLDLERGKLVPNEPPCAFFKPGAGPRHLAFHPSGHLVYVIAELDSTLTVCTWEGDSGRLELIQSISTLPVGWVGNNATADVHLSPSGRFVYGSNRGHDSLAIFAVDEQSGHIRPIGWEPTRGRTPRNFALDPSGRYLFVANQDSGNIVAFRLEDGGGRLMPTGDEIGVPAPTCVLFARS